MSDDNNKTSFAFGKINYILLAIAFILLVVGYILLSGGGSDDPNVFNPEMFNSRRMDVAPIMIVVGFIIAIVSIMYKPKKQDKE